MDLTNMSYDISYDPLYTKYHNKMPEEFKSKYEEFYLKIQKHDLNVFNDIESFSQKYEHPVINNLLYNCYVLADRYDDAIQIAEYNFNKFPDYLFGRLNYASSFLLKKDYKSIPIVFNFQFDLKGIEPSRNKFHISEVLSFHKILYYYHIGINEYSIAKSHFNFIASIDIEGKVKKELSKMNFNYKKKQIIFTILCILVTPFVLIFMIYDLIKHTIRGDKTKRPKKTRQNTSFNTTKL